MCAFDLPSGGSKAMFPLILQRLLRLVVKLVPADTLNVPANDAAIATEAIIAFANGWSKVESG